MDIIRADDMEAVLLRLLEQAREVEADIGEMPTAEEALEWALSELEQLRAGHRPDESAASPGA